MNPAVPTRCRRNGSLWSSLILLPVLAAASLAAEANFLCFGDWGYSNSDAQRAVARQMAAYATSTGIPFDAALLLGDNFYGKMPGGIKDPRWQTEFEQMYDAKALPMPFFAALGNHDYEQDKVKVQMQYAARNPSSRWKMPFNWYRLDFPPNLPLVSVFVLDSNAEKLGRAEFDRQVEWLDKELARAPRAIWTVATAHHPLFTAGQHGDTPQLVREWGKLFQKHKLDFFLCGHDHDLQHLQMEGWPTTFILAGGGGADIRPMKRADRGPFARSLNGFFHLRADYTKAAGKFIDPTGAVVHEFERDRQGKITVLKTTGIDQPAEPKKKSAKRKKNE